MGRTCVMVMQFGDQWLVDLAMQPHSHIRIYLCIGHQNKYKNVYLENVRLQAMHLTILLRGQDTKRVG